MERSKVKTIVIVLLLLLNLVFIALNLGQRREAAASARAIEESVVQILRNQGIVLDRELVPWSTALKSYAQPRERYDDRILAEKLVGEISLEASGTTWKYYGEYGVAEFSQGGAFEVHYEAGHPLAGATREEALAFLKRLGIEAQPDPSEASRGVVGAFAFFQTQDGLPVFTCDFTLVIEDGRLSQMYGKRLAGPLEPGGEAIRDAATLLTDFARAKTEGLISCGEILDIQEGYINQGLIPVWRILADEGVIYLDCITGEIRYV